MMASLTAALLGSSVRAEQAPLVTLADSFAAQWPYISSTARFNAIVCSRRAGKSSAAVRRAAAVLAARPGARVLYLTLVRRNARKYFWAPMRDYLRAHGCPHEANESGEKGLTITALGGYMEAGSCDDASDIEKARGDQWDLVIIDEAQAFRDEVIRALIDEAILPSLGDRRGSLDVLGTPPPAGPIGYLYDVYTGGAFARHHWTLFENPHFPVGEVEELCKARGLTPDHAIYKREFLGEFIVDPDSLVYEYEAGRNDRPATLEASDTWRYSLGIDLGFQDRDAIVVLGWRRDDSQHRLYEVESWQQNHLDVDALAAKFLEIYRRWHPVSVIGDTGGHGAVKVLKSLEARLGGVVTIGSKPGPGLLLTSIGLMNDDLRTGRLLLDQRGPIAHDAKLVTWKPGEIKQTVSDSYHSDITEACRYALWGARHYKGKDAPPPPTLEKQRYDAWKRQLQREKRPWS